MNKETEAQIDKILEKTNGGLSNFEKAVRPALNSTLSESINQVFELIFEAKTFAFSLAISLLIFYTFFFLSFFTGQKSQPEIIISLTIIIYPLLRAIKFVKNKIR